VFRNNYLNKKNKLHKYAIPLLVAAALVMVPFAAFAMDAITDSEMDEIIGQKGVEIRVYDVTLDLDVLNIAFSDSDCGTLTMSGVPVTFGPGYYNMNDWNLENLYFTMDTDAAGITSDANGTFVQYCAHPFTIDIVAGSTNARLNPFCVNRGRSMVTLGLPDMYIAAQEEEFSTLPPWFPHRFFLVHPTLWIAAGNMYVDDHAHTVDTAKYQDDEKWDFTKERPKKEANLGEMRVLGAEVTLHAYVGGYETANLEVGQSIHPINPNHRALIMIGPH
jgi:hypothetical protein